MISSSLTHKSKISREGMNLPISSQATHPHTPARCSFYFLTFIFGVNLFFYTHPHTYIPQHNVLSTF